MHKPIAPCINCGPDDRTSSCHVTCVGYNQFLKDLELYKQSLNKIDEDNKPIYTEGRLRILHRNIKGGKR